MSGHSKWANIKHRKAAADAKRGQLFTKLARAISVAAREGGGDPEMNVPLRLAVEKARAANMPKENVERAIQRGTGELKGEELERIMYEGYGPHGAAIMIEVLTDNRNRAVAEIRRVLGRLGGSLGETGCVAWQFERLGMIVAETDGVDQEGLALEAIDAGALDVEVDGGLITLYTAVDCLSAVREAVFQKGANVCAAEIAMLPKSVLPLDESDVVQNLRLLESLEELDDVQKVHSNIDITDEALRRFEGG
jgi:YebC/PmpR family DNA-binding regulatory protein